MCTFKITNNPNEQLSDYFLKLGGPDLSNTIEVNGIAIRLSALDCPERGTRDGEHANRLAQQFLNAKAECELTGAKTYDRLVGYCSIENQDFGLFMMLNSACKLWKNMMFGAVIKE